MSRLFAQSSPKYTVRSKSFRTGLFKNRRHVRKTHYFLFNSKLAPLAYIYKLLRGRTVSEKLPKIILFGPFLIHQLRLLGSQQHAQSEVLLTSFSTWGTENNPTEINLQSTVG